MGRAVVGLAHACGLLLVLAVSAAEPACTGSELTVKARGGIGALSVTWRLTPPCDVAETGILLGRDLNVLTRVGAAIRRFDASYSSTVPVEQTGVYWVAAWVVDTAGNLVTSEPDFAPVLVFDDDSIQAHNSAPSCSLDPA
jgi:hypothetical protein